MLPQKYVIIVLNIVDFNLRESKCLKSCLLFLWFSIYSKPKNVLTYKNIRWIQYFKIIMIMVYLYRNDRYC